MTFAGMEDRNTSSYILSDKNQVYQNNDGSPILSGLPPGLFRMECLFLVTGSIVGLLITFKLMAMNKRRNVLKKTNEGS